MGHAFEMTPHRVPWFKRLLPMSRRDRARVAQLDHTRAGMVIVADVLRDLSAQHDAHVHAIHQAARSSRGALTEAGAVNSISGVSGIRAKRAKRTRMVANKSTASQLSSRCAADLDPFQAEPHAARLHHPLPSWCGEHN